MDNPLSIEPLQLPFDGTLTVPGSKSHSNRALALAALCPGATTVSGLNPCDDVKYMSEGLKTLGWDVEWIDDTTVTISKSQVSNPKSEVTEIFCGNAGTAVRFLTAIACTVPGNWVITGDEHMQKRPIDDQVTALKMLGAEIECESGCPPVKITGGSIRGGTVELDASQSSQYLSALLLISPVLEEGLEITLTSELTSPPYVALTQQTLADFGVSVESKERSYTISPNSSLSAVSSYSVEGDWSAVGSFLVLAELSSSRVNVENVTPDSLQGDRLLPQAIKELRSPGEVNIDCTLFPDQLMNLAVLAAHRNGKTTLSGAANLRHKECDRLAVITNELQKVGVSITEFDDGVIIEKSATELTPAVLNPHNDHRMAMAFAVLSALHSGIQIEDPKCVGKTYPNFWADLDTIMNTSRCIALTGMRACGKTNLAKRLAKELRLEFKDTDKTFEKAAGSIPDFVAKHGWSHYREGEAVAVRECCIAGSVVALGGGAIESEQTRSFLKRGAVVIWVDSTPELIIKHLGETKQSHRPRLTDLEDEGEEIRQVMAQRRPLYEQAADITLPVGTTFSKQVPLVLSHLKALCSW